MSLNARPSAARMQSPLTSFVGRDEDLSRVLKNLRAARLVTLTGPGGVGKTRLAIEASGRLGAAAWFVPLAPVTDPAEVAYTVLDVLGIREPVIARRAAEPGTGPLDRLAAALGDRDQVLILDSRGIREWGSRHELAGDPNSALSALLRTGGRELLAAKGYTLHSVLTISQCFAEWERTGVVDAALLQQSREFLRTSRLA